MGDIDWSMVNPIHQSRECFALDHRAEPPLRAVSLLVKYIWPPSEVADCSWCPNMYPDSALLPRHARCMHVETAIDNMPSVRKVYGLALDSTQQHQDDTVTPQKHLADEPILIDTAFAILARLLCPHFLHVLQYHVTMAIKSLHSRK